MSTTSETTNWHTLVARHLGVQLPASAPPSGPRQHPVKNCVPSRHQKITLKTSKKKDGICVPSPVLRASVNLLLQTCSHRECQSYGILCLTNRVPSRTSVNFTFPSVLPSSALSMSSSVLSLAYSDCTLVKFFLKRVANEESPGDLSLISRVPGT